MKKLSLFSLFVVFAIALIIKPCTIKAAPDVMNGENILIQAENMILPANAKIINDTSASRSKAVNLFPEESSLLNTSALTTVKVNNPAKYTMWLRYKSDSAFKLTYRFSEGSSIYSQNLSMKQSYTWVKLNHEFDYGAGNYEIIIDSDKKFTLDCVFITSGYTVKQSEKVPTGIPTYRSQYFGTGSVPAFPKPGVHPRLYVTDEDIPALKEKLATDYFAANYRSIKETGNKDIDFVLPQGATDYENYSSCNSILLSRAFLYLLGDADEAHALETIEETKNFIGTVTFGGEDSTYASRYMGDTMVMAACVYDWCYDLLTEADKQFIIRKLQSFAEVTEVGYPATARSYVISHGCESLIYRDQFAVGIAVYDEYPQWYNQTASIVFSKLLPAKNFLGASGNDFSGSTYAQARNEGAIHAQRMIDALGFDGSIFNDNYEKLYKKFIYDRLPNGIWFKSGDDYAWDRYRPDTRSVLYGELFRYAGYKFNDPYVLRQGIVDLEFAGDFSNIFDLIFTPQNPEMKDATELTMTHFTTYPMSSMTARTSWQNGLNSPAAMVNVNMREVTVGDHQHRDIGSFQLYYKGMLALDSGLYVYSNHHYNYHIRSVAHNVMLVEDPNEEFSYANDGGQRDVRSFGSIYDDLKTLQDSIDKEECITAKDVHTYTGIGSYSPVFSYISADIKPAYSDKISAYKRSFVFVNLENSDYPAALVVYDNLKASNKDFTKKWLLHSEDEPIISGNTVTINRTDNGQSGKLVNKTLLPETISLKPVGGKENEFSVGGVNYPMSATNGVQADMGKWRTEISPEISSEEDIFLNVMYVTDMENNTSGPDIRKTEGENWIGASVENNIIIFPKTRELISQGFELTLPDNSYTQYNLIVAEIAEGKWEISGMGKKYVLMAENGKNCISLSLEGGSYTLTKVSDDYGLTSVENVEETKENFGDFLIRKNDNLMYLPEPNVLLDNTPYVAVDGIFTQFGAEIIETTQTGITFKKGKNTVAVTTGNSEYTLNGAIKTLSNVPFELNGKIYCSIADFASVLGITNVSYSNYSRLLTVRTK